MAQPPRETVPPKRPPITPASPYADQVDATRACVGINEVEQRGAIRDRRGEPDN